MASQVFAEVGAMQLQHMKSTSNMQSSKVACKSPMVERDDERTQASPIFRPSSRVSTLDTLPSLFASSCEADALWDSEDEDSRGAVRAESPKPIDVRVPGEFSFVMRGSSYVDVVDYTRSFFDDVVPAFASWPTSETAEDQLCKVSATVFVDLIPVRLKVCISADGEDCVTVALRDTSQRDIVRSKRVVDLLVGYFQSSGMNFDKSHPSLAGVRRVSAPALVDDFDLTEDESSEHEAHVRVATASDIVVTLPGDLSIVVAEPLQVVMTQVRRFLDETLPSENFWPPKVCDDQAQNVSMTVFVDYIPLKIEMCIYANGKDSSTVVLRHPSQSDIVRFRRVFEQLVAFIQKSGLCVKPPRQDQVDGIPCAVQLLDDDSDFTDDESADDESTWSDRVEFALAGIDSGSAQVREQAFKSLAHWAGASPASHVALAQCLVKRVAGIEAMLLARPPAPVVETYLLAASLRRLACGGSTQANKILSNSVIVNLFGKAAMLDLPWFVSSELATANDCLREAGM